MLYKTIIDLKTVGENGFNKYVFEVKGLRACVVPSCASKECDVTGLVVASRLTLAYVS